MLQYTAIFGVIWIVASVLLAWVLARSISRPLAMLHRGTRALMQSPEGEAHFPLPVPVHNEIGDLIEAFNRMVASIEEQRAGLSDTLVAAGFDARQCAHWPGVLRPALPLRPREPDLCRDHGDSAQPPSGPNAA